MRKINIFLIFFLFFLIATASAGSEWARPISDYCKDGICEGGLYIPGNLTIIGDYINLTVVDYDVTGDAGITGDAAIGGDLRVIGEKIYLGSAQDVSFVFNASDFITTAEVGSPNYYWKGFSSYIFDDKVGIGTLTPESMLHVDGSFKSQLSSVGGSGAGTGIVQGEIGSHDLVGVGTQFLSELTAGGTLTADGRTFMIESIEDDTHLTIAEDAGGGAMGWESPFNYTKRMYPQLVYKSNPSLPFASVGIGVENPTEILEVSGYGDIIFTTIGDLIWDIDGDLKLNPEMKVSIGTTEPEIGTILTVDGDVYFSGGGFRVYSTSFSVHPKSYFYEQMSLTSGKKFGLGTWDPTYPLEVIGDVSGISIWSDGNISASGYMTRTSVYDKTKGKALDYIKDSEHYLTDGKLDHSKFYGYAGKFKVTDYSRPVIEKYIDTECDEVLIDSYDKTSEVCEIIDGRIVCNNITEIIDNFKQVNCTRVIKERITYPYTTEKEAVSLNAEVDVLRQAVFELNERLKILEK